MINNLEEIKMKEQNGSASSGGGSILGILGVLFVGLKLANVIDWSWWFVTMPFWGGFALFLIIVIGAIGLASVRG